MMSGEYLTSTQRHRLQKAKWRYENDLCQKCGGKLPLFEYYLVHCPACLKGMRAKCDEYKAEGKCLRCGKAVDDEHVRCSKCRAILQLVRAEHRDEHNAVLRANRQARVDDGVCTYCGGEIDDDWYSQCSKCRTYHREYKRRQRARQKANAEAGTGQTANR